MKDVRTVLREILEDSHPVVAARTTPAAKETTAQSTAIEAAARRALMWDLLHLQGRLLLLEAQMLLQKVKLQQGTHPEQPMRIDTIADFEAALLDTPH